MAELVYYCGTMDSGKSTLALQTAHNHETRDRNGLIFTNRDRAGEGLISSRLGLQKNALEVDTDLNIHLPFCVAHGTGSLPVAQAVDDSYQQKQ